MSTHTSTEAAEGAEIKKPVGPSIPLIEDEEEQPTLDLAIEAANAGNFNGAARMLVKLGRGESRIVGLFEALAAYVQNKKDCHAICRRAFDDLARAQDAEVVFSTFQTEAGDPD